jgi:hypothetical protein
MTSAHTEQHRTRAAVFAACRDPLVPLSAHRTAPNSTAHVRTCDLAHTEQHAHGSLDRVQLCGRADVGDEPLLLGLQKVAYRGALPVGKSNFSKCTFPNIPQHLRNVCAECSR